MPSEFNPSYGVAKLIFDTFAGGIGSIQWFENLRKAKITILDNNYEFLVSTRTECKISCLVRIEGDPDIKPVVYRMSFNNEIKSLKFDGAKTHIVWNKSFDYHVMAQLKLWKKQYYDVISQHVPVLHYAGKVLSMFGFALSECVELKDQWSHKTIVWLGNGGSIYEYISDELAFFVRCAVAAHNHDHHLYKMDRFVNEVVLYKAYKMGLLSRRPDCKRAKQLLREMPSCYIPF